MIDLSAMVELKIQFHHRNKSTKPLQERYSKMNNNYSNNFEKAIDRVVSLLKTGNADSLAQAKELLRDRILTDGVQKRFMTRKQFCLLPFMRFIDLI